MRSFEHYIVLPEKINRRISQRHQDREEGKTLHSYSSSVVTFGPLVRNIEEDGRVDLKSARHATLVDDTAK